MPKFGKYEKDSNIAYACGVFPAMELLRNKPEAMKALLLSQESGRNEGALQLAEACRQMGLYIETAPKAIERVCGKQNCYAVAVYEKYSTSLRADRPHIVLHSVSDAGNFGTIARTCLGFGFRDIAVIRPCVDVFSPHAVRASMGAVFSLRIQMCDSFEAYLGAYSQHSMYYFRLHNAVSLYNVKVDGLPSLVFGNEASGLPVELQSGGTGVVIRHEKAIDSLNLSVAAGIGMAHFAKMMGTITND